MQDKITEIETLVKIIQSETLAENNVPHVIQGNFIHEKNDILASAILIVDLMNEKQIDFQNAWVVFIQKYKS